MRNRKEVKKYHEEILRLKNSLMELVKLETIDDYMKILGPRILGIDKGEPDFNDLLDYISEVFKRLPKEDIKVLLFERSVFFITSFASHAFPVLPSLVAKWFIVFHSKILEGTREIPLFVIAHELAHCFLRHGEKLKDAGREQKEFEANEQVKKWGFDFDAHLN